MVGLQSLQALVNGVANVIRLVGDDARAVRSSVDAEFGGEKDLGGFNQHTRLKKKTRKGEKERKAPGQVQRQGDKNSVPDPASQFS